MPSKFPVTDWEPGDHMWLGRDHQWLWPLKGRCHDWTKNDDGIGNRLAGRVTACDGCTGSWGWRRWRWRRWRRRTRGRWRLQLRFHGWLRRRSCRWLWRRSHGWLRRKSHGGPGARPLWLWEGW